MVQNALLYNGKLIMCVSCLLSLVIVWWTCRGRRRPEWKDIFLLGHVFVLTLLIYGLYTYCFFSVVFHKKQVPFDEQLWVGDRERRAEMLDDLVDRRRLQQKDSMVVIRTLGAPVRIMRDDTKCALEYYAGFRQAPFNIDPSYLFVEITKGVVTDTYIIPGFPDAL